jgi:hypothetical protein
VNGQLNSLMYAGNRRDDGVSFGKRENALPLTRYPGQDLSIVCTNRRKKKQPIIDAMPLFELLKKSDFLTYPLWS